MSQDINRHSKIKTKLPGNTQDTGGNTGFEASGCAPPVMAQKLSDKAKTKNQETQFLLDRAEVIFVPSSDVTSKTNHPPLEGHTASRPWLTSLDDLAPQELWRHQEWWKRTAAHPVQELLYHPFSPLLSSPPACTVSPFSLPSPARRALPAAHHLWHHHCLPQGKSLLSGLEDKVGGNYRN